ncbi:hypothetical protein [Sphingopyxis sp. BSNA05]|nr:hypothetical protein [Sphingopyxis sp. BSNA05]
MPEIASGESDPAKLGIDIFLRAAAAATVVREAGPSNRRQLSPV